MAISKIQTIYFSVDVAPKAHDMGRNLLRGAALDSMTDIYDGNIALLRYVGCDDSHAQIVDGIDGAKALAVTVDSGETEQYRGPHFMARVVPGTTYTASVYVKSTTGQYLYLKAKKYGATADTWYSSTHSTPMTTSTNWERKTFTFTAAEGYDYVQINFFALASGTICFCEPKLERGDTATAFSLNELDLKGASGKNNFVHVAWCNNIDSSTMKPSASEPIYLSKDTQGASYNYMGTWVSETEETTEAEARELATWVYIKGAKGDDGSTYDIYLSASVLKGDSTGKLNDSDSVPVTAKVVKLTNGTATEVTNTDEAYFTMSLTRNDGSISNDPFDVGKCTAKTFEKIFGETVKTWNFSLFVGGVFLKTVTLPVIRDGAKGDGKPATIYTIEPVGNINASGTLTDANKISVEIAGDVKAYKITGDSKEEYSSQPQSWRLSIGKENHDGTTTFNNNASNNIISFTFSDDYDLSNTPGSAVITLFTDSSLTDQLASLIVPISLNPNAIVNVDNKLGKIQNTTTRMQKDMNGIHGTIETIKQGQGEINLKVQDLQNGGIDTGKPHTSSQVDFTTLDSDNFYPVMIKFKNDDGVRHTVEIDRPLNGTYGSGEGYMTHGQGFSFRLVFSDIANAWGSYEAGQLRIESISQYWTTPADTPICPKVAQYNPFSFIIAWLRGGSKYDITVDCTDAYISGIWPYMMQVASSPSWVPDAVRLANDTWTTAQINAQAGNPYNLLKHDDGGFYADTTNDYLYRFGSLSAGHTFAIVGQPTDSKQWFMATWHITNVSGSKIYVDVSTYGLLWQAQNPLGISMDATLGYIKTGASYAKSIWDSQDGFGSSESIDNTAVHANWGAPRPILVIGTESGTGRDRAVLESVESVTEGSSVSFHSGTYFDISPLYGTDGRANVKTDLLATGIDIKSHKILATTDNFEVRNNSGTTTFKIDKDGNIVGAGNASFKGTVYASGGSFTGTVTASEFSLVSDNFTAKSDGTFKLNMTNFKVDESGNITAKGGSISFLKFDEAGMYGGVVSFSTPSYCTGISLTSTNISVGGSGGGFLSNVFLGNGRSDFRTTMAGVTVKRVDGNTDSRFYNYIRLTNTGASSVSTSNEDAALGVETDGNFCITALGGPSCFQGLCLPSASGSSSMTADGKRTMYLFSGGDFNMPSNPPNGLEIKVIQTGSKITFHANGHRFRNGLSYSDTFTSNTRGQWNFFYFDGFNWHWNYMNN